MMTKELSERQIRQLALDAAKLAAAVRLHLDSTHIAARRVADRVLKLLTDEKGPGR